MFESVACMGFCSVAGLGIGLAVELHTNEVAIDKAESAQGCIAAYPEDSGAVKDCMEYGWIPGSRSIDTTQFADFSNTPIDLLRGYVRIQRTEANHIEGSRIMATAGMGLLVGAILAYKAEEDTDEDNTDRDLYDYENDQSDASPETLQTAGDSTSPGSLSVTSFERPSEAF